VLACENYKSITLGKSCKCILESCVLGFANLCSGLFGKNDLAVNDLSLEIAVINNFDGA